jgi:formiminotetrahydrofolate cyclodeaminase
MTRTRDAGIRDYLDALASERPTPGGGSAAAVVAANGAALIAMVARITERSERFAAKHVLARSLVAEAERLRAALHEARLADEAAYGLVRGAAKLPKESAAEKTARSAALQSALAAAAQAPLNTAEVALDVAALAERAFELENANLASDLGCAVAFANAGTIAAAYNVRVNHRSIKDTALVARQAAQLHRIELASRAACERVATKLTDLLQL